MTLKKFQRIAVVIISILVASSYSCKKSSNKESSQNSLNTKEVTYTQDICNSVTSKGVDLILCKKWLDSNKKEKLIVFSKTRDDNYKEEFFVEVFSKDNLTTPIVQVYDFIKDCPVDFSINLIEDSFSLTDLNKNGINEISFLYELSCQGGLGPIKMKSIIIEDKTKYVIRGYRFDEVSIKQNFKPNYPDSKIDNYFKSKAPNNFLDFSIKKWNDFNGTKISNYSKIGNTILKKAYIDHSNIFIVLSNGKTEKIENPYFLDDENPQITISQGKALLSCGDDHGNSMELILSCSEDGNTLFLESVKGSYPQKNKKTNNLKICRVNNLNMNFKGIDIEEVYRLLKENNNCSFQTM